MELTAEFETEVPEKIIYKRGTVYMYLTGFHAYLYRGMIWMYGKAEATERFWWLWHEKENGITTPDNAVPLG